MSIAFANMTIRFLDKLCIFDKPYSVSIVLSIKINGKKKLLKIKYATRYQRIKTSRAN